MKKPEALPIEDHPRLAPVHQWKLLKLLASHNDSEAFPRGLEDKQEHRRFPFKPIYPGYLGTGPSHKTWHPVTSVLRLIEFTSDGRTFLGKPLNGKGGDCGTNTTTVHINKTLSTEV